MAYNSKHYKRRVSIASCNKHSFFFEVGLAKKTGSLSVSLNDFGGSATIYFESLKIYSSQNTFDFGSPYYVTELTKL